jgi:hypothetical protein
MELAARYDGSWKFPPIIVGGFFHRHLSDGEFHPKISGKTTIC